MTRSAWARIAIGICLLALPASGSLAGCASGGPSSPRSGSTAQPGPTLPGTPAPTATTSPVDTFSVTIKRTGGLAGVDQTIVIGPDGTWTYTDKRANKTETGRFSDTQKDDLARLVLDPRLVRELQSSPGGAVCNDAFQYQVSLGTLSGSIDDCGQSRPAVKGVIAYIADATSF